MKICGSSFSSICYFFLSFVSACVLAQEPLFQDNFERSNRIGTPIGDAVLSDDTYFSEQWGLINIGQEIGGEISGTSGADVRASLAWGITLGSPDVIVAVLDTGVDYTHPDLAENIWTNPSETGGGRETNGIDDDGNGYIDDWRGWDFVDDDNDPMDDEILGSDNIPDLYHGTAVASIIAARGDNNYGMTGIAPNVQM